MHARCLLVLLFAALSLAPAAGGQPLPLLVVKMATTAPQGSPLIGQLQRLAAIIEQRTAGLVLVKLFPAGRLGDDRKLLKDARSGALQLYAGSFRALARAHAGTEALEYPFAFTSYAEADKLLDGPVAAAVTQNLARRELIFAGWGPSVFGRWFTSGAPPRAPEAFDSLPVFAPTDSGLADLTAPGPFEALGALTAQNARALRSRHRWLVSSTTVVARVAGYDRAATHVTAARDVLHGSAIVISKRWFDGLPHRIQRALERLPPDPWQEARQLGRELDDRLVERMRARGKHVAPLPAPARAKLASLARQHAVQHQPDVDKSVQRVVAALRGEPGN